MSEIKVTISVEQDGVELPDMPVIRRYIVNQAVPPGNHTLATNSSSYAAIAADTMNPLQIVMLTPDQAINVNINQNTPLPLNANGVLLIVGANLTQGTPANNVTINNPSGVTVNYGALLGGT
jgi:hypothetical protein